MVKNYHGKFKKQLKLGMDLYDVDNIQEIGRLEETPDKPVNGLGL